ncbi:type II secretion system F family protein [Candidatus Poribacteria bacterium]|nr:type II secretion system F family protein [Candidatus Poribacteria bacterium]MYB66768.1 type II secretion system F family protein [Candidatus Poribacteria bacterium]MYF56551.1 type II secretion system F family protein [Candidatus Poribacteria bacterium]MYI94190.1 type II secretion system F family protein [Candidatus Poribacteria bacterium]
MPRYQYEAVTQSGQTINSTSEADSQAELIANLQQMGYWATNVVEEGEALETKAKRIFSVGTRRIKSAEVEFFTYQLAALVNAHVALPRSLEVTLEQISNPELHKIVAQVKHDVEHGATFNDALAQHPKVFSELYVNMVKAGEAGGVLGEVLERLAEFAERQRVLKNQVVSALFYPVILFGLMITAIIVLMILVIPKFTEMFLEFGETLPLPTQILISISDAFAAYWWVGLLGAAVIGTALRQYLRTETGKIMLDRIKLRLPLVGPVFSTFAIVRFTRTMATLLENGVRMLPALQVVKDTIGNRVYSNIVANAEREVEQGSTLSRELGESKDFPSLVTHMIAVGEESGEPVTMLSKLSEYYDMEIKKSLERLTSSISPLVILIMGLLIGFIAVAMILPIFEAQNVIGS